MHRYSCWLGGREGPGNTEPKCFFASKKRIKAGLVDSLTSIIFPGLLVMRFFFFLKSWISKS